MRNQSEPGHPRQIFRRLLVVQADFLLGRLLRLPMRLIDAGGLMGFDTGPSSLEGRLDASLGQYLLPTLTADGFLARYPQSAPPLMKIDVEEAAGAVLEGARKLLSTHGPVLLLALHGPEPERRCRAFLTELGYACHYLDGTPALDTPFRAEEILARPIKRPGR